MNSTKKTFPIAGPWITNKEVEYVADAAANGWYENAGAFNSRFENAFAKYLHVGSAASLPSCTSGLHLALAALGVGPGDEVIVPELTWVASAAPVVYVGATPIFVDVDPSTWCISPEACEAAVTPRTKAIISVDLYGNMADYEPIRLLALRSGLRIIEDAAEAVGSTYHKKLAGTLGDVGVFSFHGSKTLSTGEGGMLVTDDLALMDRVNFLRDHGRVRGDFSFQNSEVAFKYKMSAVQAALGLAQLERIEEILARKREAFGWYRDRLAGVRGLELNNPGPGVESSYWLTTIVWDDSCGISARDLRDALALQGIDTRPLFSPLSSLGAFRDRPCAQGCRERNPVSYRMQNCGINLPSSLRLQEEDVEFICRMVRQTFERAR